MVRTALHLFALASMLSFTAWAQAPRNPADPNDYLCGKARLAQQLFGDGKGSQLPGGGTGPRGPNDSYGDTDVQHYKIEVELLPAGPTVQVTTTMTVKSLVNGLTQFRYQVYSALTISSVLINGATPLSVPPAQADAYGRIQTLDRAYNQNEVFTLTVTFSGPPTNDGWAGLSWDTYDGLPFVYSMCEPWYSGRWFACKDGAPQTDGNNSDKATAEIFITTPDTLRAVSNGLLVGTDTLSGSRKRYRWATNYPTATYLFCFSAADYHTWTDIYTSPTGPMPAEFNVLPGSDTPGNRAGWDYSLTILDIFGQLFGAYPFTAEKFGIYQFGWGGGMEHQTNIGLCCFDNWIVAHEMGHQWWGDNVTCRYWNDIWLNEGFASYCEALFFQYRPGSAGWADYINWMNIRKPGSYDGTVYVYDTTNVGVIFSGTNTYNKGAWILHMLRHVVGDIAFFDGLINYRAAFEGGTAITDEFKAQMENASGQDLDSFFNQWVYGPGAPAYNIGWQALNVAGQNYAQVYISQTQTAAWPAFQMPVDLRIDLTSGKQFGPVLNDGRSQWYVIPVANAPTGVALDPNQWILHDAPVAVAYVNGPPKVLGMSPAPGSSHPAGDPNLGHMDITFSEPVNIAPGNISVTNWAGYVPFSLQATADPHIWRLVFTSTLIWGTYTVNLSDAITSVAAGIALDGEVVDPNNPANLPSGDGHSGGAAVLRFVVTPSPCPDFNSSHFVDLGDIAYVLSNFGQSGTNLPADLDHSGVVDLGDLAYVLGVYGVGCP